PRAGNFVPLAGSPAIDAGTSAVASWPVTDEAGNARYDAAMVPNTGAGPVKFCDIGSGEFLGLEHGVALPAPGVRPARPALAHRPPCAAARRPGHGGGSLALTVGRFPQPHARAGRVRARSAAGLARGMGGLRCPGTRDLVRGKNPRGRPLAAPLG